MAKIKAFKAFRPADNLVEKVASRPYDVLNSEEAREEAHGNEHSFLRIIKSEIEFPKGQDQYAKEVYEKAKEMFSAFVDKGTLVQDEDDFIYIYRLKMGAIEQTGIVALSSVEDYWDDIIKKHEFTRPEKEIDRITHIKTSGIQSGPVFLAYRNHETIDGLIADYAANNQPVYDFDAGDGVQHILWVVSEVELVNRIVALFDWEIPATYIADGHHRAASSSKVGKALAEANSEHTGKEAYNWFLSVLFPDNQLSIIDYNRLVKDLNGLSNEAFLEKLNDNFLIEEKTAAFKPEQALDFGMYLSGKWYKLTVKEGKYNTEHPVKLLDTYVLHENLFEPILGIEDQRKSKRIDFVGGIRGMKELERRVDNGEMAAAFSIFPVSISQLFAVADSGEVMPPKSTWFEPKLRSGLLVHKF